RHSHAHVNHTPAPTSSTGRPARRLNHKHYPPTSPVFCLNCRLNPPDLHSFPTRRSSDLAPGPVAEARQRRRHDLLHAHRRAVGRSEEHTSELQSLAYLVCRLLLEKKN